VVTWIARHLDCGGCDCQIACSCNDLTDPQIAGALNDMREATTPLHKRGVAGEHATLRPSSPAGPDDTGYQQRTGSSRARALRLAPDERRARSTLYPTGDVIAFPTRPPIGPEAA
jgi:hypothetical protein